MKPRILYVGDDETLRIRVVRLLRRVGYECEAVGDGGAGTQALRVGEFDCVISDLTMQGDESLEFIRSVPQVQPGVPVIILTGHPTVETAVASLQLPVMAYLLKPLDFPALLAAVREAVGHLTEGLKRAPRSALASPMESYLTITCRNVLDALLGLKTVMDHSLSVPRDPGDPADAPPLRLTEALRDTISALEKSKDAFRSRELGDLRHRLEGLLEASKQPGPPHRISEGVLLAVSVRYWRGCKKLRAEDLGLNAEDVSDRLITVEVHFLGRPEPATSFSGSLPAPPREGSRRDADSPTRFRCVELVDY